MNPITSLKDYVLSAKEELKKVSWPSRENTVRYSALVIVVSVCVAAFFASLDVGFTKLVDALITQRIEARQQTEQLPEATTGTPSTTTPPSIDFSNVTPIITPTTGTNQ
jgi:preprotein translocase subunit SecE